MAQDSKKPARNAAAKRRDYVARKALANLLAGVVCYITLGFVLLAALIGLPLAFLLIVFCVSNGAQALPANFLVGVLAFAVLCGLAFVSNRLYESLDQKARFIPYVPPVREQIAALPADEVLLRGCDRPHSRSGELLRAALDRNEARPGELLRGCFAQSGKLCGPIGRSSDSIGKEADG
jgi:uncharacterized membrane protein YbhN (UPF0104 family)